MDLDAYLARIHYTGPRAPTLETLRAVHRRHRGTIPFENLDILLGRSPRLDLPSLEAKLVAARRGGYCFEQNTLFAAVLTALGFRLQRLIGRVLSAAPPVPRPRTHMVLLAEVEGAWWLCDVGFGAWGILDPVPLAEGVYDQAGWTVTLRRDEAQDLWILGSPQCPTGPDLYAFDLQPQLASDYEMANFYTACHPSSQFRRALTVQLASAEERWIVRNNELMTLRPTGTTKELITSPEKLLELFTERFGLHFPAGTRFAIPESDG